MWRGGALPLRLQHVFAQQSTHPTLKSKESTQILNYQDGLELAGSSECNGSGWVQIRLASWIESMASAQIQSIYIKLGWELLTWSKKKKAQLEPRIIQPDSGWIVGSGQELHPPFERVSKVCRPTDECGLPSALANLLGWAVGTIHFKYWCSSFIPSFIVHWARPH